MKNALKFNVPTSFTIDEIDAVVSFLIAALTTCRVMTFTGHLGAGKTTIIKALLKKVGVADIVTSPTFTYVNAYKNEQEQTFYHFDLYRVTTLAEFVHVGFDEYLYAPESWCFIEWPEVIMPILSHDVCHVELAYVDEITRSIVVRQ